MNFFSAWGPLLLLIMTVATTLAALLLPKRMLLIFLLGVLAALVALVGDLFVYRLYNGGASVIIVGDGTFRILPDGRLVWLPLIGGFIQSSGLFWAIFALHPFLPLLGFLVGRFVFHRSHRTKLFNPAR